MNFNTAESQANTIFKNVMADLYAQWLNDNTEDSFDTFLWQNRNQLGEAFYHEVGEYFGDCDTAAEELFQD